MTYYVLTPPDEGRGADDEKKMGGTVAPTKSNRTTPKKKVPIPTTPTMDEPLPSIHPPEVVHIGMLEGPPSPLASAPNTPRGVHGSRKGVYEYEYDTNENNNDNNDNNNDNNNDDDIDVPLKVNVLHVENGGDVDGGGVEIVDTWNRTGKQHGTFAGVTSQRSTAPMVVPHRRLSPKKAKAKRELPFDEPHDQAGTLQAVPEEGNAGGPDNADTSFLRLPGLRHKDGDTTTNTVTPNKQQRQNYTSSTMTLVSPIMSSTEAIGSMSSFDMDNGGDECDGNNQEAPHDEVTPNKLNRALRTVATRSTTTKRLDYSDMPHDELMLEGRQIGPETHEGQNLSTEEDVDDEMAFGGEKRHKKHQKTVFRARPSQPNDPADLPRLEISPRSTRSDNGTRQRPVGATSTNSHNNSRLQSPMHVMSPSKVLSPASAPTPVIDPVVTARTAALSTTQTPSDRTRLRYSPNPVSPPSGDDGISRSSRRVKMTKVNTPVVNTKKSATGSGSFDPIIEVQRGGVRTFESPDLVNALSPQSGASMPLSALRDAQLSLAADPILRARSVSPSGNRIQDVDPLDAEGLRKPFRRTNSVTTPTKTTVASPGSAQEMDISPRLLPMSPSHATITSGGGGGGFGNTEPIHEDIPEEATTQHKSGRVEAFFPSNAIKLDSTDKELMELADRAANPEPRKPLNVLALSKTPTREQALSPKSHAKGAAGKTSEADDPIQTMIDDAKYFSSAAAATLSAAGMAVENLVLGSNSPATPEELVAKWRRRKRQILLETEKARKEEARKEVVRLAKARKEANSSDNPRNRTSSTGSLNIDRDEDDLAAAANNVIRETQRKQNGRAGVKLRRQSSEPLGTKDEGWWLEAELNRRGITATSSSSQISVGTEESNKSDGPPPPPPPLPTQQQENETTVEEVVDAARRSTMAERATESPLDEDIALMDDDKKNDGDGDKYSSEYSEEFHVPRVLQIDMDASASIATSSISNANIATKSIDRSQKGQDVRKGASMEADEPKNESAVVNGIGFVASDPTTVAGSPGGLRIKDIPTENVSTIKGDEIMTPARSPRMASTQPTPAVVVSDIRDKDNKNNNNPGDGDRSPTNRMDETIPDLRTGKEMMITPSRGDRAVVSSPGADKEIPITNDDQDDETPTDDGIDNSNNSKVPLILSPPRLYKTLPAPTFISVQGRADTDELGGVDSVQVDRGHIPIDDRDSRETNDDVGDKDETNDPPQEVKPEGSPTTLGNEETDDAVSKTSMDSDDTQVFSNQTPTLIKPLDDIHGICKGDIMVSLLAAKESATEPSSIVAGGAAMQVNNAVQRIRNMRKRASGKDHPLQPTKPSEDYSTSITPSRKRSALPVDVDEGRVIDGIKQVARLETDAIGHLKQDEFDDALDLYDDIIYAYTHSVFDTSEKKAEDTVDIRPYVGNALHNIGILYFLKGAFDKALSTFQKAIHTRQDCFGDTHPDTLASTVKAAMCQYALEDYSSAHRELETSLDICRGSCRAVTDFAQVAEILNNLGCLSFMCSDSEVAMRMFNESLEVQHSIRSHSLYGGPVLAGYSTSLNISITQANLGFVHMHFKRYDKATVAFEASLSTQQMLLHITSETIMSTMDHLAVSNLMAGSPDKAVLMLERMMRAQEKAFGVHDDRWNATRLKIEVVKDKANRAAGDKLETSSSPSKDTKRGPKAVLHKLKSLRKREALMCVSVSEDR